MISTFMAMINHGVERNLHLLCQKARWNEPGRDGSDARLQRPITPDSATPDAGLRRVAGVVRRRSDSAQASLAITEEKGDST